MLALVFNALLRFSEKKDAIRRLVLLVFASEFLTQVIDDLGLPILAVTVVIADVTLLTALAVFFAERSRRCPD